ncbi:hypothetical protein V0288_21290, partial [Pannus brasiliensis CCIBt3594]
IISEMSAFESFGEFEETSDETETFDNFDGFEDNATLEAIQTPTVDIISEMSAFESFGEFEETTAPELSSVDLDFLNSPALEEVESIANFEDLAIEDHEIFSSRVSPDDTSFFDLLPTEAEQSESLSTDALPSSLEELFANTNDAEANALFESLASEIENAGSNGHVDSQFSAVSEEIDLDFFSMLENSDTGASEPLPSEADLESFDELFNDDLFSEWGNGTPSQGNKIESH